MKGIDFTQLNKETLEMTLRRGITIHILPPTLEMVGDLQSCGEDIDSIKRALSKILSHNRELIKITEEGIAQRRGCHKGRNCRRVCRACRKTA